MTTPVVTIEPDTTVREIPALRLDGASGRDLDDWLGTEAEIDGKEPSPLSKWPPAN
jgi:hypothetical protein